MLTLDQLKEMEPDTVFAQGMIDNSPDGIYMTSSDIGRKLRWVAVRGGIHDWCVVVLWADRYSFEYVATNGDKVMSEEYIRRVVPCTDEAFKMYRH